MTYSESARGVTITRDRLIKELYDHQVIGSRDPGNDDPELQTVWECAEEAMVSGSWRDGTDRYDAHRVLVWLGY